MSQLKIQNYIVCKGLMHSLNASYCDNYCSFQSTFHVLPNFILWERSTFHIICIFNV